MASRLSNNFLTQLLKKEIDFDTDVFKIILMGAGFVFARATHNLYADVSANELATQYGYTAGGQVLTGVAVSQDDSLAAGKVVWNSASWTATGGALSASGAIIYDDTVVAAPGAKAIVGYIDFGGTQITNDGGVATVSTPTIAIAG